MEKNYLDVAKSWLSPSFDEETRKKVAELIDGDQKELEDRFYRTLEFGTGGLRGIMDVGTNRMNKYTVGMATQGLANYLKSLYPDAPKSVVLSYDSRNNSRFFADITAGVLLKNGIKVYMYDDIRPTPQLSFSIRHLNCNAGIMITASHNPKQYNGYKVFWEDGAQIVAPHDVNIIAEVNKITDPSQVLFNDDPALKPVTIGAEVDKAFLDSIYTLMLSLDSVKRHSDMKIVYTPLHGTGSRTVYPFLAKMGFTNVIHVKEQDVNDGDFPTVVSPNPEEPTAMKMAMELADREGADLVLASDPDADRIGLAVRNDKGELTLLTGNQIASILYAYMLERWDALGKLKEGDPYMIKTIVTTEMLTAICAKYNVQLFNVLTGFKNIATVVRENEGKRVYIGGGEESNGFNPGTFVRDKDSAATCGLLAECAAYLADRGQTLYGYLQELYAEFGYYKEGLTSIYRMGKEGAAEIQNIMKEYRQNPPKELAGSKVVEVIDYLYPEKTGLDKSNVLQFKCDDGTIVSVRPSGTEPKIKFYFGVRGADADERLAALKEQFK
ncbi:MAG: phospho-sugar mutase [Bacteroidales bacterium]|nr:phospho-sugar mutase [Candidatus Equibacterium intestinale]